jgi:hypothetical protein
VKEHQVIGAIIVAPWSHPVAPWSHHHRGEASRADEEPWRRASHIDEENERRLVGCKVDEPHCEQCFRRGILFTSEDKNERSLPGGVRGHEDKNAGVCAS